MVLIVFLLKSIALHLSLRRVGDSFRPHNIRQVKARHAAPHPEIL
jgi:hypothetical protein